MGEVPRPLVMLKGDYRPSLVALLILAASTPAIGQENSWSVDLEAGFEASDNIARLSPTLVPGTDETVYIAGLSFDLDNESESTSIDLSGSVKRYIYDKNTFDDETLATVVGYLDYSFVRDRFAWVFEVNHGQQTIDPFSAVTPENRENITILSTGPEVSMPLSRRGRLLLSADVTDVTYEESDYDNQRAGVTIGLSRTLSETSSLSLNASGRRVEYDLEEIYAPIDQHEVYLDYSVDSSRSLVELKTGWNQIKRDETKGDGLLLELVVSRQISPQAVLSLNAGSRYSTNGDIFRLCQGIQGCDRETQDQVPTDEAFQYDFIAISHSINRSRTRFSLWFSLSEEDYESENENDRRIMGARLSLGRDLSPAWSIDAAASYNEYEYSAGAREDEDTYLTLGLSLKLGSRTTARVAASRWDRTSSIATSDFDENRYSLMFTYDAFGRRDTQ